MKRILFCLALCLSAAGAPSASEKQAVISAVNTLDILRPDETVEVPWKDVLAQLPDANPDRMEVRDAETKKLVVSQNLDLDGNGKPEILVFQASFQPNETKRYLLQKALVSMRTRFENMSKTYGRFVPDRFDDYAWENDKTAHRIYGPALMTWEREPLTSSGIDIWCKSTSRLIVNAWYAGDDYHKDHGEGGDFYSVGPSRGIGGLGIWDGQKMHLSKNFTAARTLANGPVCTIFELTYASWSANGFTVSETKRIRLDGGQVLNRLTSTFRTKPKQKSMQVAVGIAEVKGGELFFNTEQGWIAYWQPVTAVPGTCLALAVMMDSSVLKGITRDERNHLALAEWTEGKPLVVFAGGSWSRSGDFPDFASWQIYLSNLSRRIHSPIRSTVETAK